MKELVVKLHTKIMLLIYRCLRKDSMELLLASYRSRGASIGDHVRAFSPIVSAEAYLITIGNNVTISTGVKFCTHDNSAIKLYDDATDFVGAIRIGDNCFIGMNSVIMCGVTVVNNCIIGAGSVVTKSVLQEGSIVAGNPARLIGNTANTKRKNQEYKFNFRKKDFEEKKKEIMEHPEKWIKR